MRIAEPEAFGGKQPQLPGKEPQKRPIEWLAYGIYALVALAIMLPLFKPGFILTLDMVFTPTLGLPDAITSSYPFHAFLHALNILIPADIIQKLLLLAILLFASIGMHRLIRLLSPKAQEIDWGIYLASIFFAINPFTYSRFMAGQYSVLLGYALLPWFVRLLLKFLNRPNLVGGLKLGSLAAVIGALSIHTLGAIAITSAIAVVIMIWRFKHKMAGYLKFGAVALGLFVLLSSYWLVPLTLGQGKTADIISEFTVADTEAFETRGGNPAVRIGHIIRLQGFWVEDRGQFLLPQDRAILWGLMALVIFALVIYGAVRLWQKNKPIAIFFAASGLVALLLAAGIFGPVGDKLLLMTGVREPHKLVGLLALTYGVLLAFGVNGLLARMREKNETAYGLAAVILLIVPFLFMRVMFWGFNGQLTPREYPKDWFTVNNQLNKDMDDFGVLFLPWHQYMHFDFAGRIIATPAPQFFGKTIVASSDPELDGASGGQQDERSRAVASLIKTGEDEPMFADKLAAQNIKYIILAKDLDYREYEYLDDLPELERVGNYDDVVLYENTAWRLP